MRQYLKDWAAVSRTIVALLAAAWLASPCCAASISYGDFGPVPPGVTFAGVVESSATDPVPLFGAPSLFAVGLDFDPMQFSASASAGSLDIADGQLNFIIESDPSVAITSISVLEAGDYSLAGVGNPATAALAGAILRATVTQIDGLNVAPLNLAPVNASVGFNLTANPGVLQPWSLGTTLNVAGQLGANQRATAVEVVIDNQLLALSEPNSLAWIAKKDFRISTETVDMQAIPIPEPATIPFIVSGCVAWGALPRRRK
jgi:hypothetical protein